MRKALALLSGAALAAAAVVYLPDLLGGGFLSAGLDATELASAGALGALGIAYLGGVLTSLTPCVYPLIPVTVGVFGARKARSRFEALLLTSLYVLGMAVMFSTLGFAAASSGKAFGTILANRAVVVILAAFFSVMALGMFGLFELSLPQPVLQRLTRVGGASHGGAFAMGLVAGIIAAPCTGPVLASLLTFVASSGQPVFGVTLLFVYALGVGLPFFLIGGFSMSLPRGGAWMDGVKSVFGIALLALALTYLRDAFPELRPPALGTPLLVGAAIASFAGVSLGAVHRSFHGALVERIAKLAGIALGAGGIFLRVSLPHEGAAAISWQTELEPALTTARAAGKPVMIDFSAEWCGACKELDKLTYVDPQVAAEAGRFVSVKIDGTNEDDRITALYARFRVQGLPTVVFLSSTGEQLEKPRITGFLEATRFLELMRQVR